MGILDSGIVETGCIQKLMALCGWLANWRTGFDDWSLLWTLRGVGIQADEMN
jgi:hypothetical protein